MMKIELTLQDKLQDLRFDCGLKLSEVSEKTRIPLSTLQRYENEDASIGYKDLRTLAKFYKVSGDYLMGLTQNKQFRNTEIDQLALSDDAIETLKERKLNNRLVSELIAHPDAPQLFGAMEVYIDRKLLPQMNTMNAVYKMAEEALRENAEVTNEDENLKILQQAVVDEDEYLRYRITERFGKLMKSLFDAHKKDTLPDEQAAVLSEIKEGFQTYLTNKEAEGAERAKMILLAKQLGLNLSKLSNEETAVIMKALRDSDLYKKARRRR